MLYTLLFAFALIGCRLWFLGFFKHDEALKEGRRPKRKTVMEYANRGTIEDRFGIPLAQNRLKYVAAIYYSHLKQIPIIAWVEDEKGVKVKTFPRKTYVSDLAKMLSKTLKLNERRVEDLIHSKAAMIPHIPFIIKEGLSEEEYYRVKGLEKDWLGLKGEMRAERFYPLGKVASHIIGYMGKISKSEYISIVQEMEVLQKFLQEDEENENPALPPSFANRKEVYDRLNYLKEISYRIDDFVGKDGLEKQFERELRGFHGRKNFEVDIKGKFLREIEGSKEAISGKKITTCISSELQKFAEELLCKEDLEREGKSYSYDPSLKKTVVQKQPWIKKGAIIALDPNNGEVWALASYPRFDPNDFISQSSLKQKRVNCWLETKKEIASVWEGKDKLTRERYSRAKSKIFEERKELSLEFFLDLILKKDSAITNALLTLNVKEAIELQEDVESLLYFSKQKKISLLFDYLFSENAESDDLFEKSEDVNSIKKRVKKALFMLHSTLDRIFFVELCRLIVYSPAFSDEMIEKMKNLSLSRYFELHHSYHRLVSVVKPLVKKLFLESDFKAWREKNLTEFLKQKRREERQSKSYSRPYVEYLDQKADELFTDFWQERRFDLLISLIRGIKGDLYKETLLQKERYIQQRLQFLFQSRDLDKFRDDFLAKLDLEPLLRSFRTFDELGRPLLLPNRKLKRESDLANSFYPEYGFGYANSAAFRENTTLGSIFKIITAYAVLKERFAILQDIATLNPFTMIDKSDGRIAGFSEDGKIYPRYYKGGRLPMSSHMDMGKIDITSAIEQSSNPYFSLIASESLSQPQALIDAAKTFGLGEKSSLKLPYEAKGALPNDLEENKTNLYSFAIGQHSLLSTPLQAALILSALVNGGKIIEPKITQSSTIVDLGEPKITLEQSTALDKPENMRDSSPTIIREIFLPPQIKNIILEGLRKVVIGENGSARAESIKKLKWDKESYEQYKTLEKEIIAKTGTAEVVYNLDLSPDAKGQKYKHIWFASTLFSPSKDGKLHHPELVVVVYLMFGDAGKEAAPLAIQIMQKYREIKSRFSTFIQCVEIR